jgi:hypothetical protein
MKVYTAAGLILAALAVSACGGRKAVEMRPGTAAAAASRWNGTLTRPAELAGVSSIQGSAWMGPNEKNADRTDASVSISNAVPGGLHPWHVHRGRCGQDQGIVGPAEAYKPLKVGGDGRSSSKAEFNVPTPTTGQYFVSVHASAQNMRTVVACGNLAPPA